MQLRLAWVFLALSLSAQEKANEVMPALPSEEDQTAATISSEDFPLGRKKPKEPKPIPLAQALTVADAQLRLQAAQIRFQEFLYNSPEWKVLQDAQRDYQAVVAKLAVDSGAEGCTLSIERKWVDCPKK